MLKTPQGTGNKQAERLRINGSAKSNPCSLIKVEC